MSLWHWRPDIRARLWIALALLALSSLFVGGIAWYALDRADNRLQALHTRTLGEVARSLRLSKQSSDLATSAPFLLNLRSPYLIRQEGQRLIEALEPILEEWPTGAFDQPLAIYSFNSEVTEVVQRIRTAITDLVAAVETLDVERDQTSAINVKLFDLENLFFDHLTEGSAAYGNQRKWLALQTLTNELVSAGHAGNLVGVGERRRRYQQMQREFDFLKSSVVHWEWAKKLNELSYGDDGLFEVRRRELSRHLESQNALFRIRFNASLINDLAGQFATNAEAFLSIERSATATSISFAKMLILGIFLASVGIALIAALYVSGYVTRNIHAISDAMQRLAAGDRDTKLRLKVRSDDEIGKLNDSFRYFRANALRLDRSHRQLRQKNALFEEIFANISDGVAITNDTGQLTSINPNFETVLQPSSGMGDKPEIAKYLANTPFSGQAQVAGLTAGFRGITEVIGDNGRVLEIRCSRLPDGGGIWLFSDVTERRKMESRLRRIQHIEGLGKVAGEVAHDFGNVLSSVSVNVHLLEAGSKTVTKAHLLQRISNAVEIGSSLVQRLLAFARKQALVPEVVELNGLIEGLTDLISIGLKDGITLKTNLSKTPFYVRVDPGQLESAILNLCLNSNQAITDEGVIWIMVKPTSADTVAVTVSDTGCGMEDAVINRSMEPFFTARADGEGTGLGLSIVYGFIKQTGGDIQISSQPGSGSQVQLTLPLCSPNHPGPAISIKRALLVEDDPEALASVAAQLKSVGFDVVLAATFEEGMAALDTQCRFDALITDLHLNEGQVGWALTEKCLEMCANTKIIVTSGRMPKRHRYTEAPNARVVCLTKPLSTDILQETLR